MRTLMYILKVTGDHAGDELRRLAHGHAVVAVEGVEVVATGADEKQGPGQQVVQPLAIHQASPDDCCLGLGEKLDLFTQGDRPVPLQSCT